MFDLWPTPYSYTMILVPLNLTPFHRRKDGIHLAKKYCSSGVRSQTMSIQVISGIAPLAVLKTSWKMMMMMMMGLGGMIDEEK